MAQSPPGALGAQIVSLIGLVVVVSGVVERGPGRQDDLAFACITAGVALVALRAIGVAAGRPYTGVERVLQAVALGLAVVATGGAGSVLIPLWLVLALEARQEERLGSAVRIVTPSLGHLAAFALGDGAGFEVGTPAAALGGASVLSLAAAAMVATAERQEERAADLRRTLAAGRDDVDASGRLVESVVDGMTVQHRFLEAVNHEMRTPLNAVLGLAETLEASERDGMRRLQLATLRRGAEDLLGIVESVLRYNTLTSGTVPVRYAPVNLPDLIDEAMAAVLAGGSHSGDLVRAEWSAGLPREILSDRLLLRAALIEIMRDALRRAGGGPIDVSARRVIGESGTDAVRIEVYLVEPGPGSGLAADDRFRGFGVESARRIADLLGGALIIEGGKGAGLVLLLPLRRNRAADGATAPPPQAGARPTVLVVDDNEANRIVAGQQLVHCGVEVVLVASGLEALEQVECRRFDAILVDCLMPGLDGYETVRRIRALGGWCTAVPVIAVTASALPEVAQRCRDVGIDRVMEKPLRLQTLRRLVAALGGSAAITSQSA